MENNLKTSKDLHISLISPAKQNAHYKNNLIFIISVYMGMTPRNDYIHKYKASQKICY